MSLVIDVFHLLSLYRALLSRTPRLASVSFSSASSVLTSRLLSNARLLIRLGWDPAYLKLPLSISQTSRKVPVDSELWLSFRFGPGFELRPVSKNSKSIDSLSEIICVIFSTLKQEIHSLFMISMVYQFFWWQYIMQVSFASWKPHLTRFTLAAVYVKINWTYLLYWLRLENATWSEITYTYWWVPFKLLYRILFPLPTSTNYSVR